MPVVDKLILPVSSDTYDKQRENIYDKAITNWASKLSNAVTNHYGWKDSLTSMATAKVAGVNVPTWSAFRNGIYAYEFSPTSMNELWLYIHITHDYAFKNGVNFDGMVYPHIHWSTTGTNAGTIRWGFEYTIARGYGFEAFPASSTIYVEQACSGVAYTHHIAEPSEGNGIYSDSLEPDSLILVRVFRDAAHGNDTLTDSAFGFFADLHYLSDNNVTSNRNRDSDGLPWKKV